MPEKRAQIILEVAEAIGTHLRVCELLAALNEKLKPIIYFDAIGIGVLEDEVLRIYSIFLESTQRVEGESLQSLMDRHAPEIEHPLSLALSDHPVSEMMRLAQPYVCADVETQRRFGHDKHCLKHGFRSYISLPLMKQGNVIGVIEFLSNRTGNYGDDEVCLLRDIAKIVAIAVANALAYEQIRSLKEQLLLESSASGRDR